VRRYTLAPEAASGLVEIWRDLSRKASFEIAGRAESAIREKIVLLARTPGAGHWRKDLTREAVRFFPIYSDLVVYRPETKPLQAVAILHGSRDVGRVLAKRV
jgi:plasmid stabilization system protein ParE